MCGIAGYHCTKDYDPRLAIALPILGMYMQERGRHSWGITNGADVKKVAGAFADGFKGEFSGEKTVLLHTRFGTVGALTADNSHPFSIKGILGVHNGQVYNHKDIADKYEIKYAVDSEVIYHRLADGGDLSEIEAYGALVFFQNGLLHMGRFNNGVLTLVRGTWGWMWASTSQAVEHALSMSGMRPDAKFNVNLKEGKLYKIDGENIYRDERKLNFAKEVVSSYRSYGGWSGGHGSTGGSCSVGTTRNSSYYSKFQDRHWDRDLCMWKDDKGNYYTKWDDDYVAFTRPVEKITAETTTFTPEPGSDYDDVIDTADSDATPTGKSCSMCNEQTDEIVVYLKETLCIDCYKFITDQPKGQSDEPPYTYGFMSYTVEDIGYYFNDLKLMQCGDCLEFPEDGATIWVEDSEQFAACDDCYQRNYAMTDINAPHTEEDEDEDPVDSEVKEGTRCPNCDYTNDNPKVVAAHKHAMHGYPLDDEQGDRAMLLNGKTWACSMCKFTNTDSEEVVNHIKSVHQVATDDRAEFAMALVPTGVEDARADEKARESAPMPY